MNIKLVFTRFIFFHIKNNILMIVLVLVTCTPFNIFLRNNNKFCCNIQPFLVLETLNMFSIFPFVHYAFVYFLNISFLHCSIFNDIFDSQNYLVKEIYTCFCNLIQDQFLFLPSLSLVWCIVEAIVKTN